MGKFWVVFLITGIIPEVVLAIYLQDIWNIDFLSSLIGVYAIITTIAISRFLMAELIFRMFIKKSLIQETYNWLVKEQWPNPWNYHIDDGISYFYEVSQNFNNEPIDINIRLQAMEAYSWVKMLENTRNLWAFWRMKKCYAEAIKKYMNECFPDSDRCV